MHSIASLSFAHKRRTELLLFNKNDEIVSHCADIEMCQIKGEIGQMLPGRFPL
jgi:hypothetical protein